VTLSWEAVPGATLYHLYAGTDVTLPRLHTSAYDVCEGGTISTPGVVDFPLVVAPPPGHMLWVVVTSEGVYGEGPPQTGSSGPFDFSSAGSCEGGCAHSVCATGGALEPACTLCASLVCQSDPACCSTTWSASCVQKVRTVCRSLACPESQGTCAHALCDGGTMLVSGCDAPPLSPSCTKAICQVDPHCCNQTWDDACIEKVAMVCRYNCL
jgi:hypothetical protein